MLPLIELIMSKRKRQPPAASTKVILLPLAAIVGLVVCSSFVVAQRALSEKERNAVGRSERAARDIETIMSLPASEGIPKQIIDRAEAVAVIPKVSRVAFIGLTQGYGVVSRRAPEGWTLPAFYGLGNKGLKLVLNKDEDTDVIIFLMNEKTVELFWKGKLGLEGDKVPHIGVVGQDIPQPALDRADIFIYVLRGGRLAGIKVDDSASNRTFVLNPDNDMNKAIYRMKGSEVLFGKMANSQTLPDGLNGFQQALTRHFVRR
jgi:lipid-binding SYLF domain-containing protein